MSAKFLRGWLLVLLLPAVSLAAPPTSTVVGAAKNADKATLKTLLQQRANVKLPEPDGTTALHWAAFNNDAEAVDLLLNAGADVAAKNSFGVPPRHRRGECRCPRRRAAPGGSRCEHGGRSMKRFS